MLGLGRCAAIMKEWTGCRNGALSSVAIVERKRIR